MSNTNFQIGIPTLNRADLLIPTVQLYLEYFPNTKIWIIDNGNQKNLDIFNNDIKTISGDCVKYPVTIIKSANNIGVAASWNILCKKIYAFADYALILNDDIYLGKTEKEILYLCKTRKFCRSTQDWAAFLMAKDVFEKIGDFDEQFYPAYYEDNDYEYRMKLAGYGYNKTPEINPIIYRTSQTLEMDKSIIEKSKKNKYLYVAKWGGLPKREIYKKPYNK